MTSANLYALLICVGCRINHVQRQGEWSFTLDCLAPPGEESFQLYVYFDPAELTWVCEKPISSLYKDLSSWQYLKGVHLVLLDMLQKRQHSRSGVEWSQLGVSDLVSWKGPDRDRVDLHTSNNLPIARYFPSTRTLLITADLI